MGLWATLTAPFRRASTRVVMLRGKYDAAQTNDDNRRHWANADGLSARAANSPGVRRTLRNRARYEVANNSYAKGIVLTLANDMIGTGPRLQLLTTQPEDNRLVERLFGEWAKEIDLAGKLRTLRMSRATDGEAFALLTRNEALRSPVKLDVKLVEADYVRAPTMSALGTDTADGIAFDQWGNPTDYHIVTDPDAIVADPRPVPASAVLHYFRCDRPGQVRGIPDLMPSLPLFAQLRRYTLATIKAAETAACFAGIAYTDQPSPDPNPDAIEPFDSIEIEHNMLVTMPYGWRSEQMKAEQPTTTYAQFKSEILNEIARCLNMPFNVATGNSSGYNYASGRLDQQVYVMSLRVERATLANVVLDRILAAWLDEAVLIEGFLPPSFRTLDADFSHTWFWDGWEHVDPSKEASAQETRLANHTTTYAHEFARQGRDWESELRQRARELTLMAELGLTTATKPAVQVEPVEDPVDDEEVANA